MIGQQTIIRCISNKASLSPSKGSGIRELKKQSIICMLEIEILKGLYMQEIYVQVCKRLQT